MKAHDIFVQAARIYFRLSDNENAGYVIHEAGGIAENDLHESCRAIRHYDKAGDCYLGINNVFSIEIYDKAISLLFKKAQDFSEDIVIRLYLSGIDKSLISTFIENVTKLYENSEKNNFFNKNKFNQGKYLFILEDYEPSLEHFNDVILNTADNDSDKELTEQCSIYACLVAILSKGPEALKYIDEIGQISKDFMQSPQYSIVKRIGESVQNKSCVELENSAKDLSIYSRNARLFYDRTKDRIRMSLTK
ncbi:hypothetical protein RF11_02711 [Thelohanellus kitauei]|uniref:Uncharacterized protein n=1 Tax=Thelohanellus kitauei TaxID=669202 RepID=A0A0C2MDR8_THEKT|nr:hypothetical protein RF11_02711 [Thelohanellus kitauei]